MTAPMLTRVSCVLFDLDGTLVDSAPGITTCLSTTIQRFGGPALEPGSLTSFVGPPVAETLGMLTGLGPDRIGEAIDFYRALYLEQGLGRSTVYRGIPALIGMLRELGVALAVATSKRESHARALLELHCLDSSFSVISGAAPDESGAGKRAVVESAVRRLAERGDDASAPVLIGDRSFDVEGALAAGIPAVFAGWGYGGTDESTGAAMVAPDPHEAGTRLRPYIRTRDRLRS
jgi:phosphoglycolate phosphatase